MAEAVESEVKADEASAVAMESTPGDATGLSESADATATDGAQELGQVSDLSYPTLKPSYRTGEAIDAHPKLAASDLLAALASKTFSVEPPLPEGLMLDPRTGMISGAFTEPQSECTYRVSTMNSTGPISAEFTLSAELGGPESLKYPGLDTSHAFLLVGSAVSLKPQVIGGKAETFSVEPSLPATLALDPSTGVISGTPDEVKEQSSYVVTAQNSVGKASLSIKFAVQLTAPAIVPPPADVGGSSLQLTPLSYPTLSSQLDAMREAGMPETGIASIKAVEVAARTAGMKGCFVLFGATANGMHTQASDCDISYMSAEGENDPVGLLRQLEAGLQGKGAMIPIYDAPVPLLKFQDSNGLELDLCIDNNLGWKNSKLIAAYCSLDPRVAELGKCIKQWSKAWQICYSTDGHLNSYSYTLLVLFFLMYTTPPVLPNLQDLAGDDDPVWVKSTRFEARWDCKFWTEAELIPPSLNTQSVGELLLGFFEFYTETLVWDTEAVAIRLALTKDYNAKPLQAELDYAWNAGEWYIEDPFDLKHNLASQCTPAGKNRILEKMKEAKSALKNADKGTEVQCLAELGKAAQLITGNTSMLKCYVPSNIKGEAFVEFLNSISPSTFKVFHPAPEQPRTGPIHTFLRFDNSADCRAVHSLNGKICEGWPLRLIRCSQWALTDARDVQGAKIQYQEFSTNPSAMWQ